MVCSDVCLIYVSINSMPVRHYMHVIALFLHSFFFTYFYNVLVLIVSLNEMGMKLLWFNFLEHVINRYSSIAALTPPTTIDLDAIVTAQRNDKELDDPSSSPFDFQDHPLPTSNHTITCDISTCKPRPLFLRHFVAPFLIHFTTLPKLIDMFGPTSIGECKRRNGIAEWHAEWIAERKMM